MMPRLFIITVCCLFFGAAKVKSRDFSESGNGDMYKCFIVTTKNNSKITFTGMFNNNKYEQVNIFYKLEIIKKGISGNSINNQSGDVTVKGNSEVVLSKVGFNLTKYDTYSIKLDVLKDNKIILSDSLDFHDSN